MTSAKDHLFHFPDALEPDFRQDYDNKALRHIRRALLIGTLIYGSLGVVDLMVSPGYHSEFWYVRYWVCLVTGLLWGGSFQPWFVAYSQLLVSLAVLLAGLGLILISFGSQHQVTDPYHAGFLLLITYSHTFIKLRFSYACWVSISLSLLHLALDLWVLPQPLEVVVNVVAYLLSANLLGMFASFSQESYMRKDFLHDRQLIIERDRSEKLLLSILPKTVVERLKHTDFFDPDHLFSSEGHTLIADNFSSVTVLFADIVNFTQLASLISATELVRLLNQIFSAFDRLAEQYQLEKIKTIGDAYMVVGGLPQPREDHAIAIANMALEMRRIIYDLGEDLQFPLDIRIGFHSGAVVAGIIGLKKMIYDLWGDTVNIASRMESSAPIGGIQVTQASYDLLRDHFQFSSRRETMIKGKGSMNTYLLVKSIESRNPEQSTN